MITTLTRLFKKTIATGKVLPLMATAISLTIAAGAVAPSFAQSTTPTTPTTKQHKHGGWSKLNLTDSQKAQLKSIRESSKAQIDAILTQPQKDQLAAAKGDRKQHREVWKSLNLTDAQKASIKQIRSDSKQKMDTVLTPEQRQQLQQMHQNHNAK